VAVTGTLHLYETKRVGLIGPNVDKNSDLARFDFVGKSPLEVIELLDTVLSTLRQVYEEAEAQKERIKQAERVKEAHANLHERIKQDDEAALNELREKLAQEDEEDETPTGKPRSQAEADAMQTKAEKPLTGRQRRGRLIEDY